MKKIEKTRRSDTPVSVVVTVFNEIHTIERLLLALGAQTLLPNEVVIVDGGSTDGTHEKLLSVQKKYPFSLLLKQKKGNRSVGRNEALRMSSSEWIAVTDAGCIPQQNWLSELRNAVPSSEMKEFVIAGYYFAQPKTPFEEAVIPYVLVMPDRVQKETFLPATRSMMFTKSVWEKVGGFNERLADNEDYAFAQKIKNAQIPILFAEKAKVMWIPRQNLRQFAWMIFRFARGDVFSGIYRPKVVFLFARYAFGFALALFLFSLLQTHFALLIFALGFGTYLAWAVQKNLRYVKSGWYWLPVLQVVADVMVMSGSVAGGVKKLTA